MDRPRIAVVQFNPKFCAVDDNIKTARDLCSNLAPGSVDLVCLSEMVFTGYVFDNAESIKPFLEDPQKGLTSRFCADLAIKLNCHVIAGYPERLLPSEFEQGVDHSGMPVTKIGANSAILYGPEGNCIGNYRKTNLFETDTTWAKPGTGFVTFHLPPPLNTVSLGICMDLNVMAPKTWVSLEEGPYELADYCLSQKTNILILLNAWLESEIDNDKEISWDTLHYWVHRLRPLWVRRIQNSEADLSDASQSETESTTRTTNVIICNRHGEENGKVFCGSSAYVRAELGLGKPDLVSFMGKNEQGVRIFTL